MCPLYIQENTWCSMWKMRVLRRWRQNSGMKHTWNWTSTSWNTSLSYELNHHKCFLKNRKFSKLHRVNLLFQRLTRWVRMASVITNDCSIPATFVAGVITFVIRNNWNRKPHIISRQNSISNHFKRVWEWISIFRKPDKCC